MEININSEIARFYKFLNQEDNTNIVFSGKFGIGKTYFIEKFFDKYKTEYTYLYLSPINYSIASNEDIFEYIKVNILLQLLEKTSVELDSIEYKFTDVAYCYLKNNSVSFFQSLFGLASNVADLADESHVSIASKFVQFCMSLKEKVDLYVDKQSASDYKNITTFIQGISNNKGSLFEYDIITQLINRIIDKIKETEDIKPIILVIDDLDRIDPEHIFRILNILSAHNNHCHTNNHKFGIDKTILVCDIINIRNIYKNKYGVDVDFSGYIDKFYSKEIFHFINIENTIKEISNIMLSMKSDYENDLKIPKSFSSKACYALLSAFLRSDTINLRTLLKIQEKVYNNNRIIYISRTAYLTNDFVSLSVFDFLKTIFSSLIDLEESIIKLTPKDIAGFEEDISVCFIALADYEKNQFKPGNYRLTDNIEYTLQNPCFPDLINNTHDFWEKNKTQLNPLAILKDAFNSYKENHRL
jgi:hypothetical protein